MHDKDTWRDAHIRKLAETYRPDPQRIADSLLYQTEARRQQEAKINHDKLREMMNKSHDLAAQAMKLADEAIARMMRK